MAKKKLTPEEATEKIREAAKSGKIVMADTNQVDDYDAIAAEFLEKIFGLDLEETFISDESNLSDFAGCCIPEDVPEALSLQDCYDVGRANMTIMINKEYGIETTPGDTLVSVFEQIWNKNKQLLN